MKTPDDRREPQRGRFLLFSLLLLFLFGGAIFLSLKGGYDWAGQFAALRGWLSPPKTPTEPARAIAVIPSFDIVRAEPTGDLVVAGRAQPGWSVRIENRNTPLGEVKADENGEWVFQPDQPLPPGDHSLSLRAISEDGKASEIGSQRIAVSVAPKQAEPAIVAMTEAGKPTKILSEPDASKPAEAKETPKTPDTATATIEPKAAAKQEAAATVKPATAGAAELPRVAFKSVDYERDGASGVMFANGEATPGSRVMLYINNAFAGMAIAGPDNSWSFSGARDLPPGSHQIRADVVEEGSGKVLARAEVSFEQRKPEEIAGDRSVVGAVQPSAPAQPEFERARQKDRTAATTPPLRDGAVAKGTASPPAEPPSARATETARVATAAVSPETRANPRPRRRATRRGCRVAVVRDGDTLWHIAQRCYGDGDRFSKIFRSNKGQIRDPDLIYPDQRFVVPR